MPIQAIDPRELLQREEKEREFIRETEDRRLAHNLKVAEMEAEVASIRNRYVGITRILLLPVLFVDVICITYLAAKGKKIPKVLEELISL